VNPACYRGLEVFSADAGYCSEANLETLEACGINGYIAGQAPDRKQRQSQRALDACMRKKIADGGFETPCALRKQIVEPVFWH